MFLQCRDLPRERKNLFGKFPEQGSLGGVGEHQHNIDVARSELHQVAGVRDVCQLCHFHKVLLRRTAAWTDEKDRERERKAGMTFIWIICILYSEISQLSEHVNDGCVCTIINIVHITLVRYCIRTQFPHFLKCPPQYITNSDNIKRVSTKSRLNESINELKHRRAHTVTARTRSVLSSLTDKSSIALLMVENPSYMSTEMY